MAASNDEIEKAIIAHLRAKHLPPTKNWVASYVATVRTQTPLVVQQKSALFRILVTDLTASIDLSVAKGFPQEIGDATIRERTLPGSILAQVLDIEDIGRSRWSQVEALEAAARGETTKGREVIRVVPDEQSGSDSNARQTASAGPHKLLLEDARGTKVFAVEFEAVQGISTQMKIGAKLLLRDVIVARGVLFLSPASVEILGGKVEVWDEKWRSERLSILKRMAGLEAPERTSSG